MENKYIKYALSFLVIVLLILLFVWMKNKEAKTDGSIDTNAPTSGTNKPLSPTYKPKASSVQKPVDLKPSESSLTAKNLEGQLFRLSSYNGLVVPSDSLYTISFSGGNMSVKFCNNLSGSFVLDSGVITSSNIIGTKMFCNIPSNLMDMEGSFISILNFGANITKVDNGIMISGSKGNIYVFTGFVN